MPPICSLLMPCGSVALPFWGIAKNEKAVIFKKKFFKSGRINNEVEVIIKTLIAMAWLSAQVHLCGP